MADAWGVNVVACRARQQRLCAALSEMDLDGALVTQREHVQWLTGVYYPAVFSPLAAITTEGHCLLVAPQKPPELAAADDIVTYVAKCHSTLRNDQKQMAAEAFSLQWLANGRSRRRLGTEFSTFPEVLHDRLPSAWIDIEPLLYRLRRRKEQDELARLRKAIQATERMFARARRLIAPGVSELDIFNALQSEAVLEFEEPLTGTGNDYQCGARGGPPRPRPAESGELYILDLGPAFRGYFADTCRTIAVDTVTTDQHTAWECVTAVFEHVESTVRPGSSARELFLQVQAMLDQAPCGVFNHHLGHGIGLFPHEAPHLNPDWNDQFELGDVFAVEPGLYAPELRAGMRIENDYVVTAQGVERLSCFPMELQ